MAHETPPPADAATEPALPHRGAIATLWRGEPLYYGYYIAMAAFVAQFVTVATSQHVSGAFLKPMSEELGWTRVQYTYAQTVSQFTTAFLGVYIGVHVDRFGGRRLMLAGAGIAALSLLGVSHVQELWQWMLLRGLCFTIGAALVGSLVVNITLSKWFVERRGQVIGLAGMGVSLSGTLTPPLTTWVIDSVGWRIAWDVIALGALSLAIPCALVMRRQPEDHGLHPDGKTDEDISRGGGAAAARDFANSFTRGEALRTPAFYMIVLAFGLGGIGLGALLLQTIPFLTDAGYSRGLAALMSSAMSFAALLSKPFWGWAADRWQPKVLAALGFVIAGVAIVVIVFAANHHVVPLLAGTYFVMGWGIGGQLPLQETVWASYFGRRYLGAVRSMAMPFALFLGAGGPLAVSYYFDIVGNYDGAFYMMGAIWLVATALMLAVPEPVKPGTAAV